MKELSTSKTEEDNAVDQYAMAFVDAAFVAKIYADGLRNGKKRAITKLLKSLAEVPTRTIEHMSNDMVWLGDIKKLIEEALNDKYA
jgi:hypothetical protein